MISTFTEAFRLGQYRLRMHRLRSSSARISTLPVDRIGVRNRSGDWRVTHHVSNDLGANLRDRTLITGRVLLGAPEFYPRRKWYQMQAQSLCRRPVDRETPPSGAILPPRQLRVWSPKVTLTVASFVRPSLADEPLSGAAAVQSQRAPQGAYCQLLSSPYSALVNCRCRPRRAEPLGSDPGRKSRQTQVQMTCQCQSAN